MQIDDVILGNLIESYLAEQSDPVFLREDDIIEVTPCKNDAPMYYCRVCRGLFKTMHFSFISGIVQCPKCTGNNHYKYMAICADHGLMNIVEDIGSPQICPVLLCGKELIYECKNCSYKSNNRGHMVRHRCSKIRSQRIERWIRELQQDVFCGLVKN